MEQVFSPFLRQQWKYTSLCCIIVPEFRATKEKDYYYKKVLQYLLLIQHPANGQLMENIFSLLSQALSQIVPYSLYNRYVVVL